MNTNELVFRLPRVFFIEGTMDFIIFAYVDVLPMIYQRLVFKWSAISIPYRTAASEQLQRLPSV